MAKKKRKRTKTDRRYRILSLDGGGIRGLITAIWLRRLEEKLGGPVADCFDLVAGTSTGSILACAISNRIAAAEIVDLYRLHGREVFPSPVARQWNRFTRLFSQGVSAPKYDDAGLASVLERTFGDTRFGDLAPKPVLLVTSYNTLTRQAVVFKNTRPRYDRLRVWEAAKASCSAPTYFPAHVTAALGATMPLIDGGVVANNPSACALAEAVRINREKSRGKVRLEQFVVASFGTGQTTRPIPADEAREWGALEWAVPVIDVLMDGAADAVHYISRNLLQPERYFRFQTPLNRAFDDIDDASETNINALMAVAEDYLEAEQGNEQLDAVIKLIR